MFEEKCPHCKGTGKKPITIETLREYLCDTIERNADGNCGLCSQCPLSPTGNFEELVGKVVKE